MRIFSLGETAAVVEFGQEISLALNDRVRGLANYLRQNPFAGMLELVPAYASLAVFYDLIVVRRAFPEFQSAFDAVRNVLENALENNVAVASSSEKIVEIPVCYDGADLEFVARHNDLTEAEVVELHTAQIYTVFMLGFLPGFAYLGELDARLAAPRRSAPRTRIPAGSVGIAGRQTGVYPLASPGGWQIIGRTDLRLFTPERTPPTLLQTGDKVKFVIVQCF